MDSRYIHYNYFPVFFITVFFIFFGLITTACCQDCSNSCSCYNWEDGWPLFCDEKGFKLEFHDGSLHRLEMVGGVIYRVLHIEESAHIMKLVREDLLDHTCLPLQQRKVNTTLNTTLFKYPPNGRNLTLSYHCEEGEHYNFSCPEGETSEIISILNVNSVEELSLQQGTNCFLGDWEKLKKVLHSGFSVEYLVKKQETTQARNLTLIAVSTSVSIFVLLLLGGVFIYWTRRKKQEQDQDFHLDEQTKPQDFPSIPLDVVSSATEQFSHDNKLGEGGFGPVYKGTLSGGKEIAVKRLSRSSEQGLTEFKNEITLIAKLQHRNLVRLLGCCLERNETLLIYEYMPNKSLDVFLFDSSMGVQLDWKRRHNIINGIARGILYLHEDSRLRIIHRDLKASNVLLDQDMNPKISDFGMARIVGGNQIEDNTNRVVGTYGYMAPEYAMEGLFSIKSDVFSFGVLLLEIISGKKNSRFYISQSGHSLLTYAWKLWSEGRGIEVMDPLLVQSYSVEEVLKCIHIGLLCVQEDPADRPTMSSVVLMLGSETVTLAQPTEPAFSVGRVVATTPNPSEIANKFWSVNEVSCTNLSPR